MLTTKLFEGDEWRLCIETLTMIHGTFVKFRECASVSSDPTQRLQFA